MTAKMQREDAVSGFSFLFPARYSPGKDGSAPQELGLDLGSSSFIPLGGRWSLQLLPSWKSPLALPRLPAGMSNPSGCRGCSSNTTWEKTKPKFCSKIQSESIFEDNPPVCFILTFSKIFLLTVFEGHHGLSIAMNLFHSHLCRATTTLCAHLKSNGRRQTSGKPGFQVFSLAAPTKKKKRENFGQN